MSQRHAQSSVERRRVFSTSAIGVLTVAVAAIWCPWQMAILVGFIVKAAVELVWIWRHIGHLDAAQTRAMAAAEDDGPAAFSAMVILTPTMALPGVVAALMKARQVAAPQSGVLIGVAVLTVVSAWLLVHSSYVLRYARHYYSEPVGGIQFTGIDGEPEDPDYRDFAYVAFTVGMSFTVSETTPSSRKLRRVITRHGLLSYLFGTVIVGMVINVMAGLIG